MSLITVAIITRRETSSVEDIEDQMALGPGKKAVPDVLEEDARPAPKALLRAIRQHSSRQARAGSVIPLAPLLPPAA